MASQPADYSQSYDFVYKIERRIGYLEKDLNFIEQHVDALESKRTEDFKSLSTELQQLHSEITSLKNHFSECMHGMARLGKELKSSVKNENMQSLNAKVDEIKFEEYVTRSDLKRMEDER